MNRKGDVALTILVLVALVGAIALLSIFFYTKSQKLNMPLEISDMMVEVEGAQQYLIAETRTISLEAINHEPDLKEGFISLAGKRDNNVLSFGNFFEKVKKGDFVFEDRHDGTYLFRMEKVIIKSQKGANSVVRRFDIELVLNSGVNSWKDISDFN